MFNSPLKNATIVPPAGQIGISSLLYSTWLKVSFLLGQHLLPVWKKSNCLIYSITITVKSYLIPLKNQPTMGPWDRNLLWAHTKILCLLYLPYVNFFAVIRHNTKHVSKVPPKLMRNLVWDFVLGPTC